MSEVNSKFMWKIFVPTRDNDGNRFGLTYHQKWDEKVRSITGGLTITKTSKGQWLNDGKLFHERMIPVEIYCTESEIDEIIQITMKYYRQIAVMCYRISDLVKLVYDDKD